MSDKKEALAPSEPKPENFEGLLAGHSKPSPRDGFYAKTYGSGSFTDLERSIKESKWILKDKEGIARDISAGRVTGSIAKARADVDSWNAMVDVQQKRHAEASIKLGFAQIYDPAVLEVGKDKLFDPQAPVFPAKSAESPEKAAGPKR